MNHCVRIAHGPAKTLLPVVLGCLLVSVASAQQPAETSPLLAPPAPATAPPAARPIADPKFGKPDTAPPPAIDTRRGDRMFADYFAAETERLRGGVLHNIQTADQWNEQKDELRRQLHEMLGLDPLPERTPLNPVVTGTLDHPQFTVEKLHFQSSPQLYVTGSLYVPKGLTQPVPAILYVCGHGNNTKDGVSYGSKTAYQHHGAWFARHGYVCLILDTLQLGEIEGLHHGVFREGMFWWYSRGFTPAGVEVWNGIRAIDYLQSRKEVDPEKIGLTGRSGGGAMTWYIAACDERIKAAVPTAGITDLEDHVVNGCIEGHCDCMFQVNTYGWDYGTVAALIAPRPLLVSNTDDDKIFPLRGVEAIHWQLRDLYEKLGVPKKLGLQVSWGGHFDTQELQVAAFRWFNLNLKKEDPKIEVAALKLFTPEELKVFDKLPTDQRNTTAHEWFVPTAAKPQVPRDAAEWATMRGEWLRLLATKSFRGWPAASDDLQVEERRYRSALDGSATSIAVDFTSQGAVRLSAGVIPLKEKKPVERLTVVVGTTHPSKETAAPEHFASITPRGLEDTAWSTVAKKQTQHRRRFMLLGQTLEGQQVYDVYQGLQALKTVPELKHAKITLVARGQLAAIALYAALFEPTIDRLELYDLPASHMPTSDDPKWFAGPLLNVLKYLDIPQAVAIVAERNEVKITTRHPAALEYPLKVAEALGWKGRVTVSAAAE